MVNFPAAVRRSQLRCSSRLSFARTFSAWRPVTSMPARWAAISRHATEQTVRVALALDGGFIDKASLEAFLDRVMTPAARPAEPLIRSPLIPLESKPGGLIRLEAPGSDGAIPSPWVPGACTVELPPPPPLRKPDVPASMTGKDAEEQVPSPRPATGIPKLSDSRTRCQAAVNRLSSSALPPQPVTNADTARSDGSRSP